MREALDVGLLERRNRLAAGVVQRLSLVVELEQPDREQLHELARIVLVGPDVACGVGLAVAEHRQVDAHGRVQRHVLQQLAEVAEGIRRERVVVARRREVPRNSAAFCETTMISDSANATR